jgi:hypothetical protein
VGVVFAVFSTVAFAWAVLNGAFSFLRWLREPTFEVQWASFASERKGEGPWTVKGGDITVVAFGGARTCKVVNWNVMLFRPTGNGSKVGRGTGLIPAPILESIPAHESTKFTLHVELGMVLEEGIPERLTGELYLRVDKDWTRVDFGLYSVHTGDFYLDTPVEEQAPLFRPIPWWKRAANRLRRIF